MGRVILSFWFLLNWNCSGYLDLLPRQNYWDPTFGRWPTHTVSKYPLGWGTGRYFSVSFLICLNPDPSNINILQEPQIPIGKLCPENWKYFQGSCYLLRNQVKYHSSYFSQHFAISCLSCLSFQIVHNFQAGNIFPVKYISLAGLVGLLQIY